MFVNIITLFIDIKILFKIKLKIIYANNIIFSMGNECTSCFNKAGDNKIEDLSYKNPIINKIIQEQNENQNQDLSYINM